MVGQEARACPRATATAIFKHGVWTRENEETRRAMRAKVREIRGLLRAGFWTLDRTTITGRSAVILRQHTTPFRPMIVPFDDLELVYQSLRTLEPPHTHKFPRVNAQDCKLGPIQPWDVKDFFGVVGLPVERGARKGHDGALDLGSVAYVDWAHFYSNRRRSGLDYGELADPGS